MKTKRHRFLCAVLTLVLLVSALPLAAFAAEPESSSQTLTAEDAVEMQQADQAVTALTDSEAYSDMTQTERQDAALAQLEELADQGLVDPSSIQVDEEHSMVSFTYHCGVLGGILLTDPDETDNTAFSLPQNPAGVPAVTQPVDGTLTLTDLKKNKVEDFGTAMIYYAFDNTVNSSRYPYYNYMKGFWTAVGLNTNLNTTVTVDDLRKMGDYDLCILSAHGAYYTYSYGLLWKRTATKPVILLTEEAAPYKDLRYGFDLLSHRIIKINGLYSVTPDFFRASYFFNHMEHTIVLSETCEFGGIDGSVDSSMADSLLAAGAKAVVGYVNNVYTVYSRSMLWDTVNQLVLGQTIEQSLNHAKSTYGANDLVWYRAQGGRRPHATAAYPLLYGDTRAKLPESSYIQSLQAEQAAAQGTPDSHDTADRTDLRPAA